MTSMQVKELAFRLGADVCGIADVERFPNAPKGFHPVDILPETKSVIVFGKQFPKGVFRSKTNTTYMLTREHLLRAVDGIAVQLVSELEQEGFYAVPIPSAEPYEYWDAVNREGRGILSLKHAAALAGLGSIGKSTLLINRTYGNRLWLGAVLTDAELDADEIGKSLCPDGCRICLDTCPQQALDGVTIVQKKCREICFASSEGGGGYYACNLCRSQCPFCQV